VLHLLAVDLTTIVYFIQYSWLQFFENSHWDTLGCLLTSASLTVLEGFGEVVGSNDVGSVEVGDSPS